MVLTTFDDDDHVYGALRAGASGFLVKDMALDDIIGAVRVVAAGDALIAPGVTRRLIQHFAARPGPARGRRELRGITDREREVLTLVGTGLSNAEIAAELCISVATAKTYLTRLLTKLDARDACSWSSPRTRRGWCRWRADVVGRIPPMPPSR